MGCFKGAVKEATCTIYEISGRITKGRISLENTYGPSKPKYLRCAHHHFKLYITQLEFTSSVIESFMAFLIIKSSKFISVKGQLIDTSVLIKNPPHHGTPNTM